MGGMRRATLGLKWKPTGRGSLGAGLGSPGLQSACLASSLELLCKHPGCFAHPTRSPLSGRVQRPSMSFNHS